MVYCFLAQGFEELEAIAAIDMLKRANIEVKTVGVGSKEISGAHSICIKSDISESEVLLDDDLEAVVLPGGMPGTVNLENSSIVQNAIDFCNEKGKLICAICAAPSILGHKKLLSGKEAVCYPGFEKELYGCNLSDDYVAKCGNIITAKGAGVAVDFGLEIVSSLKSAQEAQEIRNSIQCR